MSNLTKLTYCSLIFSCSSPLTCLLLQIAHTLSGLKNIHLTGVRNRDFPQTTCYQMERDYHFYNVNKAVMFKVLHNHNTKEDHVMQIKSTILRH